MSKAVGMFALALWDASSRTLTLARDRFGEKPLYYGWAGKRLPLRIGAEGSAAPSRLRQSGQPPGARAFSRPAPTFLRHCRLSNASTSCRRAVCSPLPREACAAPRDEPPEEGKDGEGSASAATGPIATSSGAGSLIRLQANRKRSEHLEQTLVAAIKGQAVADVPVGAFLSGGVDSSTIVALYQRHSSSPVRTFTIGFDEAGYNEADHACAVARHLETVHDEYR